MTPEDTRAWAEFYAAMTRLGLDPDVEAGHWPPAAPDTTPGPSTGLFQHRPPTNWEKP